MPRTRVVYDLVHDEDLTDREMATLAKASLDFGKAVGSVGIMVVDKEESFSHAHTHISTEDSMCPTCRALGRDERS